MAQDSKKIFERAKDLPLSKDRPDLSGEKSEKVESGREKALESEAAVSALNQEEQKPLEKIGEALKSSGKSPLTITSSDLERQKQIDSILSEGLNDIFLNLSVAEQRIFKDEGEKTVLKIDQVLQAAKVKIKIIIGLIKKWLKLIPRVNPYFLEQEAKIKADKIIKLRK